MKRKTKDILAAIALTVLGAALTAWAFIVATN